jgi:phospholipid/cholesterol/gamma-HCH transport system substrate-binding protein
MNTNAVETLIGTLVIAIAAGFLVFAYSMGDVAKVNGYKLTANFERADGVNVGTDVRISGIKVGSVIEQKLDSATYFARLVVSVDKAIKVPEDSSIKIASDGLLGGNYLSIQPGGSETALADGGEITNTQPSIDLMSLVTRALFSPGKPGGASPPAGNGKTPAPAGGAPDAGPMP